MRKAKKKTTFVIAVLSVLLVAAVTSTIVLAAFSAQKSATTTINFADGLKMSLEPKGTNGTFQIASAGISTTTFYYNSNNEITNQTGPVTLDGITATLNKSGYVAYKMVLKETTSGSPVSITGGSWSGTSSTITFTVTGVPSSPGTNWKAVLSIPSTFTATPSGDSVVVSCGQWTGTGAALTKDLFDSVVFSGYSNADIIDDLAGRTFALEITIGANTDSAPTLS